VAEQVIREFRGGHHFLSNFYRHTFQFGGLEWPTAEHAYQATKAATGGDPAVVRRIQSCTSPGDAKRLGRAATINQREWEEIKVPAMLEVLRAKFADPDMSEALLATGEALLQEGNNWGDDFWGVCPPGGNGRNMLGELLMRVRDEQRGRRDYGPVLA
jgi:ribA/ribD-fused uncharacterized protein